MTDKPLSETEAQARQFFAQEDFAAAEPCFRQLIHEQPDNPTAHYNLGVTLGKLERYEEAIACYRQTFTLNPYFVDTYINLGVCLDELNMRKQARQAFALARKIQPDHHIAILNEGIAALSLGDFGPGWKDFSARWQLPSYAKFKRHFDKPYWAGEELQGKTLFLFGEQGFGDTLQMARYIPVLMAMGAKIIVEPPPALTRLIKNMDNALTVINRGEDIPAFDYYCAMMDIPSALKTTADTIPSTIPYLFAYENEIAAYKDRREGSKKIYVGLSWAGRASHGNDHNRSLKFDKLSALLKDDSIEWISLQRIVSDQDRPQLLASSMTDWGTGFDDFATAAAAIQAVDLVITVDTALAHLAGALGKPVWIMLPFAADWRWQDEGETSLWYKTARLFRQKKRKEWEGVIERIKTALDEFRQNFKPK